jgi:LemA protein
MVFLSVILVAVLFWAVLIYNRLVRDSNQVKTAWSDIDVQLKRRYDLIPKLTHVVEGYSWHERSTLETLTKLRSQAQQATDPQTRSKLEQTLGGSLRQLFALVEAYPELKADTVFSQLQQQISDIENQIQYARRFYNGAVRNLNTRISSFPDFILARLFRFVPQQFFVIEPTEQGVPASGGKP